MFSFKLFFPSSLLPNSFLYAIHRKFHMRRLARNRKLFFFSSKRKIDNLLHCVPHFSISFFLRSEKCLFFRLQPRLSFIAAGFVCSTYTMLKYQSDGWHTFFCRVSLIKHKKKWELEKELNNCCAYGFKG